MTTDIDGTLQQWHRITVDFTGPHLQEQPSTFIDYRLNVTLQSPRNGHDDHCPRVLRRGR